MKRLGLSQLGDGECRRSGIHLQAGDLRNLVRLRMGSEAHTSFSSECRHPYQVSLETIAVDYELRTVDPGRKIQKASWIASKLRQPPPDRIGPHQHPPIAIIALHARYGSIVQRSRSSRPSADITEASTSVADRFV